MNKPLLSLVYTSLICSLIFPISSCKQKEQVVSKKKQPQSAKRADELMEEVSKSNVTFDYMTIKSTAEVKSDDKSHSFKTTIRIKKDSIIWVSIAPLMGIEAARIELTRDSVKMMNRLENNYYSGNYEFLSQKVDADVNYHLIEALITGNSLPVELEEGELLKVSHDQKHYMLSSLKRKKLKRTIEKREKLENKAKTNKLERKSEKFDDIVESIWFDPSYNKIVKQSVNDINQQQSLEALYSDFRKIENTTFIFPNRIEFLINSEKSASMTFSVSKITVNEETSFPFKIPEKYERVF